MKRRPPAPLEPLTVLTHPECAKWLKISERSLDRLRPPSLPLTEGLRRYMVRDVLTWLEQRRAAA